LVGIPEGKILIGRPGLRWADNVQMINIMAGPSIGFIWLRAGLVWHG